MEQRRLLLSFFTARDFYEDPVRSFLTSLRALAGPVRVADLPGDLYSAAAELLESDSPVHGTLELPGRGRLPIAVSVGLRDEGWRALVLDLGSAASFVALVHTAAEDVFTTLGALAASGGRTLSADFAVLSGEPEGARTRWQLQARDRFEPGDSLLMLWARITMWDAVAALRGPDWHVERQWDGALLITLAEQA